MTKLNMNIEYLIQMFDIDSYNNVRLDSRHGPDDAKHIVADHAKQARR